MAYTRPVSCPGASTVSTRYSAAPRPGDFDALVDSESSPGGAAWLATGAILVVLPCHMSP